MKELSIEEKAKAYDEAIIRGSRLWESDTITRENYEYIFPEVKESEDERIRKEIIEDYRSAKRLCREGEEGTKSILDEKIAWLEKQGEQNLADKVEPKFEIGDLITNGILVGEIDEIHEFGYHAYFGDHYADVPDVENWHKWTIQDVKDGDVLVNQNGEMPFIFKECKNNHIYCYCGYTNCKDIFFDRFANSEGEELHWLNLYYEQVYPATKEQRDLLFQKMHESGYEWDAEKKELKKIKQNPANEVGNYDHKEVLQIIINEQNSAWSEEDEKMAESCENAIVFELTDNARDDELKTDPRLKWLKSLKDRVQPQDTWKPSDEQIEYLSKAIFTLGNEGDCATAAELFELRDNLKMLREK